MRFSVFLACVGISAIGCAQLPPLFSAEERDSVLRYWSDPIRYTSTVPADALEKGLWQVRLTVAGSKWLWDYQRGKKIPPTSTPIPQTEEQKQWEDWIKAKLARDRWEALKIAQDANQRVLGKRLPEADQNTPATEPPRPGPEPESLLAHCGNAPQLAEAVVPMAHSVVFDDVTISYRDNTRLSSPRYAYYRFEKGVMSGGVPVKSFAPEKIAALNAMAGISESEARIMRAVSILEGGFDSVNTYDTGFVSIGFIQFASLSGGSNSLGALLKMYKESDPVAYQQDFKRFGIDVTSDGILQVLDLSTGAEANGADANREIIEDKRLISVFQRAGLKSDKFNAMQLKAARDLYLPSNDSLTLQVGDVTLTGKVTDVIKSEAGMAVLMDRKVNTGKLDPLVSVLSELANEVKPQSLSDLAAYERDIVTKLKYRKDYLADTSLSQPPASPVRASQPASRGSGSSRSTRGGKNGH
jgi:hypothetical protein